MITQDQIIPLLIEAEPEFAVRLTLQRQNWSGGQVLSLELLEFAYHLVQSIATHGELKSHEKAYQTLERFFLEGDKDVKRVSMMCLLESIQDLVISTGLDPKRVEKHMGPETLRRWTMLRDFWDQVNRRAG